MTGYKLFRKFKDGTLHALYVNGKNVIPVGQWINAECGERKDNGKVKSSLGDLAYRPGWHLNDDAPHVEHIYTKFYTENGGFVEENTGRRFDKIHKYDGEIQYVWCLVEYGTKDYQPMANKAGLNKKGKIVASRAQLDYIPVGGFYKYKTSANMRGAWVISGEMKIIRELSRQEVINKCKECGLIALPTLDEYKAQHGIV